MAGYQLKQLALLDGGLRKLTSSIFIHLEEGLKASQNLAALIVPHQAPDYLAKLLETGSQRSTTPISNGDASCLTWTFSQLHHAALNLAKGFIASGLKPGMTIATLIDNGAEYAVLLWTCAILKVALAALDRGALLGPRREELQNFLVALKPDVVVVPNSEGALAVDEAADAVKVHPRLRVFPTGQPIHSWQSFAEIGALGRDYDIDEVALLSSARNDDLARTASILFTSGTSAGKPKGCVQRVATLSNNLDSGGYELDNKHSYVLVNSANFRTIAPTRSLAVWKAGAAVVLLTPTSTPAEILDCVERYKIYSLIMGPASVHALVAEPSFAGRDVSCVTSVRLGGDMITKSLMQKAATAFPKAAVGVGHGMTEGGSLYKWAFNHTVLNNMPFFGEIAPIGRINAGAKVKIWDHESNRVAYRGEPGEVHACSQGLITHYLGNTNAETFYKDDDGNQWFRTGDLGMINDDGIVYVLGRIKDVIKRASIPITPAALESCIDAFTGAQTTVLAIPSPTLGQEPFAVLDSFRGKTEPQIQQQVLNLFGKDYAINGATTLEQLGLESFPLNATGKVMKIELLTHVKRYLQSQ